MSSEKPDQIQASVAAALSRLRGDLGPSGATAPRLDDPPMGDRGAVERTRPANDVRGDPFFKAIQSPPPGPARRAPIPMTPFSRMQAPQEPAASSTSSSTPPDEPQADDPRADELGRSVRADELGATAEPTSSIEIPPMPKRTPCARPGSDAGVQRHVLRAARAILDGIGDGATDSRAAAGSGARESLGARDARRGPGGFAGPGAARSAGRPAAAADQRAADDRHGIGRHAPPPAQSPDARGCRGHHRRCDRRLAVDQRRAQHGSAGGCRRDDAGEDKARGRGRPAGAEPGCPGAGPDPAPGRNRDAGAGAADDAARAIRRTGADRGGKHRAGCRRTRNLGSARGRYAACARRALGRDAASVDRRERNGREQCGHVAEPRGRASLARTGISARATGANGGGSRGNRAGARATRARARSGSDRA